MATSAVRAALGGSRRVYGSQGRGMCTAAAQSAWARVRREASEMEAKCPTFGLRTLVKERVLKHETLSQGLSIELSQKLRSNGNTFVDYEGVMKHALKEEPTIADAAAADMEAFQRVDPAAEGFLGVYLFYKGFQALQCARVAHYYWCRPDGGGRMLARLLQSEMSDVFGIDVHPGAQFGRGVTIDHGTGLVVGETAIIGNNVYMMHDVTLGATGTSTTFDRHPKIGNNSFIAAKATVLGNITIGENAVVGAGAVVNKSVPAGHTAVGVPAKNLTPKVPQQKETQREVYEKWIAKQPYSTSDLCI